MHSAWDLRARGERRTIQVARGDFGELGRQRGFQAARAGDEKIEGH